VLTADVLRGRNEQLRAMDKGDTHVIHGGEGHGGGGGGEAEDEEEGEAGLE
jgi:hypothetical protein